MNINTDKEYLTGDYEAYDAELYPPPKNVLLLCITKYGILQKSRFIDNWHVAWYPLPREPQTVKDRRSKLMTENF